MTMLKLMALGARSLDAISLTGWSDVSFSAPTTQGDNEDRTLTWAVGPSSRTISAVEIGDAFMSLYYRINSGSWTIYSGPFSLTSGQTLAWRIESDANQSGSVTVRDDTRGADIDTFNSTVTGY